MTSRLQHSLSMALRLAVASVCCAGIWYSFAIARADHLFRQHTKTSVQAAISVAPDDWKYYMRLAQFSGEDSQKLLIDALHLDRFNAEADIEVGLQYESDGNYAAAERYLLDAYAVDHTYLPRWTLANYYFRRQNLPAFWKWARSAADMPSGDIGALFELCWHVTPNADQINAAIANNKPTFLRPYIGFLLSKQQYAAAAAMAERLIRYGNAGSDRSTLLSAINGLAGAGDPRPAVSLWQQLIHQHWVVADTTLPNNADFARDPLPVVFDWRIPQYSGLYSLGGPSGLQTVFSGNEPEQCILATQTVAASAGNGTFQYTYQTAGIPPGSGLRWQIFLANSNKLLAQSPSLSSEAPVQSSLAFTVPASASLVELRLVYQRAPGTSRISGTLNVQSTRIKTGSPS